MNYISNELKQKIISGYNISNTELKDFFKYVTYKVNIIKTYKENINENLSLEYTALFSEICFSHNLEIKKMNINNHYFCIVKINDDNYLFDLCESKYNEKKLNAKIYDEYQTYIKEKYYE